jgi:hypothetical protein
MTVYRFQGDYLRLKPAIAPSFFGGSFSSQPVNGRGIMSSASTRQWLNSGIRLAIIDAIARIRHSSRHGDEHEQRQQGEDQWKKDGSARAGEAIGWR